MNKGYYLTSGPTLTANWKSTGSVDAATGNDVPAGTWTVPFGGGIGQIRTAGSSANKLDAAVLWERNPSAGSFTVEF